MKNLLWAILALCSVCLFTACGDDEEDDGQPTGCQAATLSGMIDSETFNLGSGRAIIDNSGEVSIRLYDERETFEDPCLANDEFVNVFGTLPNAEVGRTELFLDLAAGEGQTLTFFNPDGFQNIIAADGFIEFTAVTATTIEGFMDIDDGTGNPEDFLCGSFTLNICQ